MRITVIAIGRTERGYFADTVDDYLRRVSRYARAELRCIPYPKGRGGEGADELCVREGELILQAIAPLAQVFALDERGDHFTSEAFAQWLDARMRIGAKELVFVLGGAYGLSPQVKARANGSIALSRFTLPHQLARLVFMEQLYRGFTILRGEPYHHG